MLLFCVFLQLTLLFCLQFLFLFVLVFLTRWQLCTDLELLCFPYENPCEFLVNDKDFYIIYAFLKKILKVCLLVTVSLENLVFPSETLMTQGLTCFLPFKKNRVTTFSIDLNRLMCVHGQSMRK